MNTGQWSKKAIKEASRYCDVNVVASSEDQNYSCIPSFESWQIDPDGSYLHLHRTKHWGVGFSGFQKLICL